MEYRDPVWGSVGKVLGAAPPGKGMEILAVEVLCLQGPGCCENFHMLGREPVQGLSGPFLLGDSGSPGPIC